MHAYRKAVRAVRSTVRGGLYEILALTVVGGVLFLGMMVFFHNMHSKTRRPVLTQNQRLDSLSQLDDKDRLHNEHPIEGHREEWRARLNSQRQEEQKEGQQKPEQEDRQPIETKPERKSDVPALTFSSDGEQFLLRGKPFRILSGELHYFRVVPQYWKDRLLRLKAAGLNTVSTYVAWNLHEPHPGVFDFTPNTFTDIVQFLKIAHELGLYVLLRPGPYICAEWEFGGMPGWLLRSNAGEIRTNGEWFMKSTRRYLNRLYKEVKYQQHAYGGPIIAVQLENEYGAFGNSRLYLEGLRQIAIAGGVTELLFKCDDHNGLQKTLVQLPGVLQAVNGNDRVRWHMTQLRKNQVKKSPIFVAELWTGWFTLFAGDFSTKATAEVATATRQWLEQGASINYYMWHGGSNFYHNGAVNGPYRVMTSSYDYDAPVAENGTLMPKFFALRKVLKEVLGSQVQFGKIPPNIPVKAYGSFKVSRFLPLAGLRKLFSTAIKMEQVCSMEELPINNNTGQVMGFTLYRHVHEFPLIGSQSLSVSGVGDFAAVLVNNKLIGHVNQQFDSGSAMFTIPPSQLKVEKVTLDILVGSTGRNNYLPDGSEKKGLLWPIYLNSERVSDWEVYPFEFDTAFIRNVYDNLISLKPVLDDPIPEGPVLSYANVRIEKRPCDTYLRLPGFRRGLVIVNNQVLGRYWDTGPQKTLYLPAPLLRSGLNEFLIMEMMYTPASPVIELVDSPDIGKTPGS